MWIPKNSIAYGVRVSDYLSEGMTGNGHGLDGRAMVDCRLDNVKAWIIGGKQDQRFRNVYVKDRIDK